MGKERKGATNTTMLIIAAVVMLLIVFGIFLAKFYPFMRYGAFSPCWAIAVSNVRTLAAHDFIREPQDVVLGDCISGFYLVNDADFDAVSKEIQRDFKEELDCPPDGKSYVIAVPILPGGEWTWDIFKLPKEAYNELKQRFLGSVGVSAYCKKLSSERDFSNPHSFRGDQTYCIDIGKDKDSDTYTIYYCLGECEECGPNPNNPSPFEPDTEETTGNWIEPTRGI